MEKFLTWDRIVSLLLIAASVVLYFINIPESGVKAVAFWVMMLVALAMLFLPKRENLNVAMRVARIIVPLAACCSLLFLDAKLSTAVDFGIIIWAWSIYFRSCVDSAKAYAFSSAVLLSMVAMGFALAHGVKKEDALRQPAEEVVLEYVDIKSDYDIRVYVKDKGIFEVSSSVLENWNFQAGDTVKVVIYNDEIISCEN